MGFYYDFIEKPFFTRRFEVKIEKEMNIIVKADHPFIEQEMSSRGYKRFTEMGETYKVEIIRTWGRTQ